MSKKKLFEDKIYLKRLEFVSDVNPIKKGLVIDFIKPVCFLVGDNGVGKSTIMECLASHYGYSDDTYLKRREMKANISLKSIDEKFDHKYIDFHSGDKKFSGSFGDNISLQMMQQRASAGQCSIAMLNTSGLDKFKDGLVLLDEPCRGLSMKNQKNIAYMIIELMLLKKSQVIVVTHSDIIMKKLNHLAQFYSVSEGKDTTYEDFLKTQE